MTGKMKPEHRNRLLQMLYDEGLTLRECGELLNLSTSRVGQIVDSRGRQWPGLHKSASTPPSWLIQLVEIGAMTAARAAEYWGCHASTISTRTEGDLRLRGSRSNPHLSTPAARSALYEMTCCIVARAWMDGATVGELANLLETSAGYVQRMMSRMRRAGYCLPKRRPPAPDRPTNHKRRRP